MNKPIPSTRGRRARAALRHAAVWAGACALAASAQATTTTFFQASQPMSLDSSGITSNLLSSLDYGFRYTQDKLFTGGTGVVIGRTNLVTWPVGLHAQAVTTPPPGQAPQKASVVVRRADDLPFDLGALTFRLFANTAGAGGSLEIMPIYADGSEPPDPIALDATGFSGNTFTYSGAVLAPLANARQLTMSLYVDFGLLSLTVTDAAPVPEPPRAALVLAGLLALAGVARRRGATRPA